MKLEGFSNKKYKSIVDCFSKNFRDHDELGAALCLYHRHEKVVDVWAGHKDLKRQKVWEEDTVVPVFSTSKAIAASCLGLCHSKGLFNYEDRVCDHWPKFGSNDKTEITIEQLLQHRAGLSAIDRGLDINTIQNRDLLSELIAKQRPLWKPGAHQGYHVWTIGWYISSLLKRLDPMNRFLKEFIEQEFLPNIEGEVRIGVDQNYDWGNIADLQPFSKLSGLVGMPVKFVFEFFKPWSITFKSMLNPLFVSDHSNFNRPEILQLEIGSGNGIANARGLASLIDALSDPSHKLHLKNETRQYLENYPSRPEKGWEDKIFKQDAFRFHAGFMKPSSKHDFSSSKSAYGGFGAGGSFVFHDPHRQITASYVMNKMASDTMNMKREMNIRDSIDCLFGA